jgi:hypothetical protein
MAKALSEVLKIINSPCADGEIAPKHDWKKFFDHLGDRPIPQTSYEIYCEERGLHGIEPMSKLDFERLFESDGGGTEGQI